MANRQAAAAPRSTTARKNAASVSRRKCEPSHGMPERQDHGLGRCGSEQMLRGGERRAVSAAVARTDRRPTRSPLAARPTDDGDDGGREEGAAARRSMRGVGVMAAASSSRTPRPAARARGMIGDELDAAWLRAPPPSFIDRSTLPRIAPSLASMRWMVGSDKPDNSASRRWSRPSSAREARSCAAVIMFETSMTNSLLILNTIQSKNHSSIQ